MYAQRFPRLRTFAAPIRFGLVALPLVLVLFACSSVSSSDGGDVKRGGACRSSTECSGVESCYLPGQSNCGIAPRNECVVGAACNTSSSIPEVLDAGDSDATADSGDAGSTADSGNAAAPDGVCVAAGGCGGSRCVPRCKDDTACGGSLVGHCTVATGVCGPPLCTTDAECKSPNLVCATGSVRTCVAKPCSADTECSGFCRNGTCSELGTCSLPAP